MTNSTPGVHEHLLLKGLWPKLMEVKALQPWLASHERDFLEAQAKSVLEEGRVFNTGIVANWCDHTIAAAEKRKAKYEAIQNTKRLTDEP